MIFDIVKNIANEKIALLNRANIIFELSCVLSSSEVPHDVAVTSCQLVYVGLSSYLDSYNDAPCWLVVLLRTASQACDSMKAPHPGLQSCGHVS